MGFIGNHGNHQHLDSRFACFEGKAAVFGSGGTIIGALQIYIGPAHCHAGSVGDLARNEGLGKYGVLAKKEYRKKEHFDHGRLFVMMVKKYGLYGTKLGDHRRIKKNG